MVDLFHSLNVSVKNLPDHKEVAESNAMPTDYKSPARIEPKIEISPVATSYHVPAATIDLQTNDYDPELEYELSAVVDDQQKDRKLRHELIYVSPNHDSPIDLSADHEIWTDTNSSLSSDN